MRVVFAGALLLAMIAVWNQDSLRRASLAANGLRSPQSTRQQSAFAVKMLANIAMVQFGAVVLLVPMFLCGAVADAALERSTSSSPRT